MLWYEYHKERTVELDPPKYDGGSVSILEVRVQPCGSKIANNGKTRDDGNAVSRFACEDKAQVQK